MTGTTISHYRVLEKLGSGGMGVVYKAEDLRLKRFVALKFLSEPLSRDPQALQRFQREAEASSALNHPNICTIYDVDRANGQNFIVMELLEGQSLRERIGERPLPLDTLVDLATQAADALDAAHSKGIIHRDLKPANIFVNPRGQVKILDFGLAKLLAHPDLVAGASDALTLSGELHTSPGTTLGTVAYMSPEQVRADDLDARSDLFSLGAVLYEMATGVRAFSGKSLGLIQDAILNHAPAPVSQVNPQVPEKLEEIIDRALEKDRTLRYQSAADLRAELKRLIVHEATARSLTSRRGRTGPGSPLSARSRFARPGRLALGALIVAAILSGLAAAFWKPAVSTPSRRLLPFTSLPGLKREAALSPDGHQMAFAWNGGDGDAFSIYVKLVGAGSELRLTNAEGVDWSPAWSPDSRFIAFRRQLPSGSGYYTVPALGTGRELKVATSHASQVSLGRTIDWSPDGQFLVTADAVEAGGRLNLLLMPAEKGEIRELLRQPAPYLSSPMFSPDGKFIAYVAGTGFLAQDVYVVPVEGGEPKQLTFEKMHLAGLAWTADGRRLVFSSNRGGLFSLWEVPVAGGDPTAVASAGEDALSPTTSRRGDRLGYVRMQADSNIWRAPIPAMVGAAPAKWIASTRDDWQPEYSRAGDRIAFVSTRSGSREIWMSGADGAHPVQLTAFGGAPTGTPRWSPDGQRIAFDSRAPGNSAIYVVSVEGGLPRRLTQDDAENVVPAWSADGQSIYFVSGRDGREQVWKMPSAGGPAIRVTEHGGRNAMESPDGRHLYYWRAGWIYRRSLAGGAETRVAEAGEWGYWVAREQGLFILNADARPGPTIDLLDALSGVKKEIAALETWPRVSAPPSFDVSRDGRWALFVRVDQIDNDVMILENFR